VTTTALRGLEIPPGTRLWLLAFGKAAHAMAAGAVAALGPNAHAIAGGVVVSPELAPAPHSSVVVLRGDHPLPRRQSFTAAERIGDLAVSKRVGDVVIVLISGGTTSLIAAPLRGMSEADLGHLFELLLGSGLDIRAMNAIRKRFTRWGAGRLALALAPARTHVFLMSDVLGDEPADIGSGPCTPDLYEVRDVMELLRRSTLLARLPAALRDYLTGVAQGAIPETPKPMHPAFAHVITRVIGSNRLALDAVVARARELALPIERAGDPLAGGAALCGATVAESLVQRAERGERGCVVWGGETTVQLSAAPGLAPTGGGGRCQELALAAARVLAVGGDAARRVTLLAAGTDGRDGPTDAAGAFADAELWETIAGSGHDPELALARHESYSALDAAGALLRRGHTGTNVMDVVIGLVE
jgi:hydroxypyruvate reductase